MPSGSGSTAQPFAHLQAQNSPLYRAVLTAFGRAKQRFTVHLRPEDVLADLHGDTSPEHGDTSLETVTAALAQLAEWGNLRADPDTGRVTTVEDFHRARYLYQLSPYGHAAEQAIATYEEAIGRRGALQSVALSDIAAQLRALLVIATDATIGGPPDAAKTHLLMMSIVDRFTGLADNAQAFMASLRRTIDFADADLDAFIAYKEQLISYIERFIADLANRGAEIAGLAHQIETAGVVPLLEVVARREAADAAPNGGDGDADAAYEAALDEAMTAWRQRWQGLRDWFVSSDSSRQSQARLLRTAAIGSIRQLLGTVAAINERRAGRTDRSADFRTLALWFALAPDDESAHQLWHTAFGLSPARHLTTTTETQARNQERPVPASTPWDRAPRQEISPRLRRTGSYERRGAPTRVIDRSQQRRLLAEHTEREAAQTARARAALVTPGPVALSRLGELDSAEFRLFLQLLGDALATRRPDSREVVTATSDGTLQVRLVLVDQAEPVRIVTRDGVLTGPEHLIEITDIAPTAARTNR
ncbi:TIGR02677 family protein [Micromonospora sp. NBC_01699]|uniref:TIGR02677 family protein n=1 Tax=Micromonospora sp. NBC_01699 TaxID=2975984 RepID=UPI002E2BFD51|nr:TIGR02677 family protein [Micromonospora sp. NBC_01699]